MERRTKVAITFTTIYLIGVVLVVLFRDVKLFGLGLNELGDFVAGAFGPLALAWLIFGYFQQGDELQQGTEALRIQAEELRNSVEQQRQLASISLQSLELERAERLEQEVRRRNNLTPIFHLECPKLNFEEGNYVAMCRLFNDGAQVFSLSVMIVKGGSKRHCASIRTLGRGERSDFKITWPLESPGDHLTIVVHYTDRDSLQGISRFESEPNEQPGELSFFRNDDLV